MTTTRALPTTIGSIVTFTSWMDAAKTEPFLIVTTLIPGAITDGQAHHVVWTDANTQGELRDAFDPQAIIDGDFTVLFEAEANPELRPLDGVESEGNYGEVVTYVDPTDPSEEPERLTATFTPGFIDEATGELGEAAWMNSYGGYISSVEDHDPLVYVKGFRG
jgi:hypothetical protein